MTRPELILASASPRRHELLTTAGLTHEILTSPADEKAIPFTPGKPEEYVMAVSRLKNDAVWAAYPDKCRGRIVLSADTIVYAPWNDEVLGKPVEHADAVRMLTMLSGRTHRVITGVTMRFPEGELRGFAEATDVTFRSLSADEIGEYCATAEPCDKAGAYGIQGLASVFVRRISGDYCNVVGLPVCRICEEIRK